MPRILILSALAAVTLAGGCEPRARAADGVPAFRGAAVEPPIEKPAFTLTATDGRPFDFRGETDGYLTLLFFGYTNCPDVCPVHMANLGAVIRELPPSDQRRVKVVFVTTDPARDTPARMREWLDTFHRDFIGLTGHPDTLTQMQHAMGIRAAMLGEPDAHGNYDVGHAASVFAFTPDDRGRFMYPFGIRQADWAHDLPRLLNKVWPGD